MQAAICAERINWMSEAEGEIQIFQTSARPELHTIIVLSGQDPWKMTASIHYVLPDQWNRVHCGRGYMSERFTVDSAHPDYLINCLKKKDYSVFPVYCLF